MYLNCHSWFSFLYGMLSPEKLLGQAKKYGVERFVLTDINNTSACLQVSRLSKNLNMEVILGIDFRNQLQQQFIGISKNQDGFEKLNRLLSIHLKSELPFADKCDIRADVFIIYPFNPAKNYELDENEFIGINHKDLHYLNLKKWNQYHNKLVILHPVSLDNKDDYHLHKLLRAIAGNTILSKIKTQDLACADEVFLDESDFMDEYQAYPYVIENTFKLLEQCNIIDFDFNQHKNKSIIDTHPDKEIARENDYEVLEKLAYDGAKVRYKIITQKVKDRLKKELTLIRSQKFVPYFLINFDIVSFARKRGFFYIGRGSGANSVVAYCLRITDVDPIELDLYFERFINVYRKNPPDFDIDFSWQDRNELIQYIFDKYGLENVCLQATTLLFRQILFLES